MSEDIEFLSLLLPLTCKEIIWRLIFSWIEVSSEPGSLRFWQYPLISLSYDKSIASQMKNNFGKLSFLFLFFEVINFDLVFNRTHFHFLFLRIPLVKFRLPSRLDLGSVFKPWNSKLSFSFKQHTHHAHTQALGYLSGIPAAKAYVTNRVATASFCSPIHDSLTDSFPE